MNKGTPATPDRRAGGRGLRIASRLRARACLTLLALTLLGCSDDAASPLAPTPIASNDQGGRASGGLATPGAAVEGSFGPLTPSAGLHGVPAPPLTSMAGVDAGSAVVVAPAIVSELASGSLDLHAPGLEASGIALDHAAGLPGAPDSGMELAASPAGTRRTAMHHEPCPAAGGDAVDLKASAPRPLQPLDGAQIRERMPVFVVSNATGTFAPGATFRYWFALDKRVGGRLTEAEVGCGSPRDNASTSFSVTRPLDLGASYVWRARAFLDGAYGPWSADTTFRTPAFRLGVPQPRAPIDGVTVPVSTTFTVRNPDVEGTVNGNVDIQIQVALATDTDFTGDVKRGRTHMRGGGRGETDVPLTGTLMPGTRYHWRARATASAGAAGQVTSAWSDAKPFRTSAFRFSPPQPLLPRNGEVDVPISPRPSRPQFTVTNTRAVGHTGEILVQLEVARDEGFANIVARQRSDPGRNGVRQRPGGETSIWINRALMPGTQYYWHVRAKLGNRDVTSDWSAVRSFTTGSSSSGPTTASGRGDCCPPPNRFDIVQAVVARTGNLYRQDVQQFTQRVAECLAATDGDWGRRRNDSGTVGKDTVAYRTSKGPGRGPFSIDILLGATGSDPRPHWNVQEHEGIEGRVGGTWLAVDGANCVLGSVSAR